MKRLKLVLAVGVVIDRGVDSFRRPAMARDRDDRDNHHRFV